MIDVKVNEGHVEVAINGDFKKVMAECAMILDAVSIEINKETGLPEDVVRALIVAAIIEIDLNHKHVERKSTSIDTEKIEKILNNIRKEK